MVGDQEASKKIEMEIAKNEDVKLGDEEVGCLNQKQESNIRRIGKKME